MFVQETRDTQFQQRLTTDWLVQINAAFAAELFWFLSQLGHHVIASPKKTFSWNLPKDDRRRARRRRQWGRQQDKYI